MENYYDILEVSKDASFDEIKRNYRRLSKKFHPDVYKGEDGELKFKMLSEAYSVVGNPEKRAVYDSLGNGSNYQEVKFDYDKLSKEQKEFLEFLKERQAFRNIVEEELAHAKEIFDIKNQLELAGLNDSITEEEYYEQVKRLINESSLIYGALDELAKRAVDLDLFILKEQLYNSISIISQIIDELPLSLKELKQNEKLKLRNNLISQELNYLNYQVKENGVQLQNLLVDVYKRKITRIDYISYRSGLLLVFEDLHSRLHSLKKLTEDEKHINILEQLSGTIKSYVEILPEDYKDAIRFGNIIEKVQLIDQFLFEWNTIYFPKIEKIKRLLDRYPNSCHYEELYYYAQQIFDDELEKFQEFRNLLPKLSTSDGKIFDDFTNMFATYYGANTEKNSLYRQYLQLSIIKDKSLNPYKNIKILGDEKFQIEKCPKVFSEKKQFIYTRRELIDLYLSKHKLKVGTSVLAITTFINTFFSFGMFLVPEIINSESQNQSNPQYLALSMGSLAATFFLCCFGTYVNRVEDYYYKYIKNNDENSKLLEMVKEKK